MPRFRYLATITVAAAALAAVPSAAAASPTPTPTPRPTVSPTPSPTIQPAPEQLRLHCEGIGQPWATTTDAAVDDALSSTADEVAARYGIACKWSMSQSRRFAGYRLIRSDGYTRTVVFRTRDRERTNYLDRAVRPGQTYVYRIDALDADGRVIGTGGPVKATAPWVEHRASVAPCTPATRPMRFAVASCAAGRPRSIRRRRPSCSIGRSTGVGAKPCSRVNWTRPSTSTPRSGPAIGSAT